MRLKKRKDKFLTTDEDEDVSTLRGVFTEQSFTNANQLVEKSVIDLFCENENDGNCSDLHFISPLDNIN